MKISYTNFLRVDIKTQRPLHKSVAFRKTYIFGAFNSKNNFRKILFLNDFLLLRQMQNYA